MRRFGSAAPRDPTEVFGQSDGQRHEAGGEEERRGRREAHECAVSYNLSMGDVKILYCTA